jgi:uncharacterized protein (TIGR00251 family)
LLKSTIKDGVLTFQVLVVPRSSRSEIVGEHDGRLKVRLAAPPVEGAANEELIRLLAKQLRITRSTLLIKSGSSSKLKTIAVTGLTSQMLESLLK